MQCCLLRREGISAGECLHFGFTYLCIYLHLDVVEKVLPKAIAATSQLWGNQPPENKTDMKIFIDLPPDFLLGEATGIYCSSHFKFYFHKASNIHNILCIFLPTGLFPAPNTVVIAQKKKKCFDCQHEECCVFQSKDEWIQWTITGYRKLRWQHAIGVLSKSTRGREKKSTPPGKNPGCV